MELSSRCSICIFSTSRDLEGLIAYNFIYSYSCLYQCYFLFDMFYWVGHINVISSINSIAKTNEDTNQTLRFLRINIFYFIIRLLLAIAPFSLLFAKLSCQWQNVITGHITMKAYNVYKYKIYTLLIALVIHIALHIVHLIQWLPTQYARAFVYLH